MGGGVGCDRLVWPGRSWQATATAGLGSGVLRTERQGVNIWSREEVDFI